MVHILCIGFKFDDCHVAQVRHKICIWVLKVDFISPKLAKVLHQETKVGSEGNGRCLFQGCYLSSPNVTFATTNRFST